MHRGLRTFILAALLLTPITGCDRGSPSQNPTSTSGDSSPVHRAVEVSLITPLLPRLRTHLAVDSHGNLYWVQESDPATEAGDLMFVMGTSGVPQTLPALSGRRLLESLGETNAKDKDARCAVRSMV